jgi:hypothetical protein
MPLFKGNFIEMVFLDAYHMMGLKLYDIVKLFSM